MIKDVLNSLSGKGILVVGAGRSGDAAVRLLLSKGARVLLIDSAINENLKKKADELKKLGADVLLGVDNISDIDFDLVVVSPGVSTKSGLVKTFIDLKKPVIGELELGYHFVSSKIVAITGTNGKTTTTELVEKIFTGCGYKSIACGNIGLPLCDVAIQEAKYDFLSLEVSSFQLETIIDFKPNVAILTNITPDHFDRYSSIKEYIAAKVRIFENQSNDDWAVVQKETKDLLEKEGIKIRANLITYSAADLSADVYLKGQKIISRKRFLPREVLGMDSMKLKGSHNAENLMATLIVSAIYKLPIKKVLSILRNYSPAPHRCELVAEIKGVKYVNDSKATNVDAVAKAILNMEANQTGTPNILLIAGGKDKMFAFDEIKPILKQRVKAAFLIGETAEKIFDSWKDCVQCYNSETIDNAVVMASKMAEPGDVVLLSPACSSFDQFRNYEHRGEFFRECVEKLKNYHILDNNVNKNTI
ncbi:MAG TPA: UDP-N-acetylmuramoyl-L-alanine--D-glutamate ligase [Verrucomicrobiota bacterium]|nr:UDP-N-acetylmuramoyl-L-alanine--D-glutamate ligase [Verrucomicrobiota bacterium]